MAVDPETFAVSTDIFLLMQAADKAAARAVLDVPNNAAVTAVVAAVNALSAALEPYQEKIDAGVSGTFTDADGKTITVEAGIITAITNPA